MDENTIKCPECGAEIPLTEALYGRIKEGLKKEFELKARKRELELEKREKEMAEKSREMEKDYQRKLALERKKLEDEALGRAREKLDLEMKDLREQNQEKERLLEEARKTELEFRKRTRELEEKRKSMDLMMARKMDAEREKIKREALEMFSEEHRLKDMEKDKRISDMLKQIEDLRRKAEQGSQQAQGEVLELDLENLLAENYPGDVVEPVPKGIRGADILQKVFTRGGRYCGTIVWESKRTKAWNNDWIPKLKDDQREINADVAVIVSEAMPEGVRTFGLVNGVWVASVTLALPLAEVLRQGIIQVAASRTSAVGKSEKMETLYEYLSGSEFKHKVEGIVEAFLAMKDDLESEKRAMNRLWAKREKQIERVFNNTSRLYGDMQGIIGATLPEIKALELGPGPEDSD